MSSTSAGKKLPNSYNDIGDQDVVCGRGGTINSHKGNIFYRSLVVKNKSKYLASSQLEKKLIAKSIIDAIRRRGGRFLKWSSDRPNELVDIGDVAAMDKTCQSLREGLNVRANNKKKKEDNKQPSPPSNKSSSSNDENKVSNVNDAPKPEPVFVNQVEYSSNHMRNSNARETLHNYCYPTSTNSFSGYEGISPNGEQHAYIQVDTSTYINQNQSTNKDTEDKKSVLLLGRCTCKKSQCLKLYCQCFSNSMYCTYDHCRCTNCYNSLYYNQMVHEAKERIDKKTVAVSRRKTGKATV